MEDSGPDFVLGFDNAFHISHGLKSKLWVFLLFYIYIIFVLSREMVTMAI